MKLSSLPRYAASEFRKHYDDPHWYRDRIRHYALGGFHRRVWPGYSGSIRVMDQDWDNLIVLDACRRSLFEDVVGTAFFDDYQVVRSLGSNTGEWSNRNFNDKSRQHEFPDTVYVTGNVVVSRRITEPTFHRLYEVWQNGFDEDLGVVPPEPVVDKALEARAQHPNKRLVAHIVQPHEPFIVNRDDGDGYTANPETVFGAGTELMEKNTWLDLAAGNISVERAKAAYARTLEVGWKRARELITELPGRTVVTADHGNMWGERGFPIPVPVYGHPTQLRCSSLVDVPWGVVEADGDRPEITDGRLRGVGTDDQNSSRGQLRALGYIE